MKQKHEKKDGAYLKIKKEKHDIVLIEGLLHFPHRVITNYNGQEIRLVC
jgi:hypothetical protein